MYLSLESGWNPPKHNYVLKNKTEVKVKWGEAEGDRNGRNMLFCVGNGT
jgi:hypothetical protein